MQAVFHLLFLIHIGQESVHSETVNHSVTFMSDSGTTQIQLKAAGTHRRNPIRNLAQQKMCTNCISQNTAFNKNIWTTLRTNSCNFWS